MLLNSKLQKEHKLSDGINNIKAGDKVVGSGFSEVVESVNDVSRMIKISNQPEISALGLQNFVNKGICELIVV